MKARNAVIYARYSSHNQKDTSIEDQIKVCTKYAKNKNINPAVRGGTRNEMASLKVPARPYRN